MKYIIKESKLSKLIFRYLDDNEYELINFNSGNIQLKSNDEPVIYYFSDDYGLYVTNALVTDISSVFSISHNQTLSIVAEWFRGLVGSNIKINNVYRVA